MDVVKTGALIARVRREKNMTQKELAEALHVSTQAVSKWERARSFPDVALLEPLAEILDLTVSELLAGERGQGPREDTVRDFLRFSLAQLGGKVRRWRALFLAALLLLAALAGWRGYRFLRDGTELFPQRVTEIAPRESTPAEDLAAGISGDGSVSLFFFDTKLADEAAALRLTMELWTPEGMADSWDVMSWDGAWSGAFPRRQPLAVALTVDWRPDGGAGLDVGVSYLGTTARLEEELPYPDSGVLISGLTRPVRVAGGEGATLACLAMDGGEGYIRSGWRPQGTITQPPEECAYLLLRFYSE